jgi:DNA-binding FrmR family transcriptional regulator
MMPRAIVPRYPEGVLSNRYTKSIEEERAVSPSDDVVIESATPLDRKSTSYAADKAKILARLRRIEGQVRGVQGMVERDQYCIDVLTQLSSIIAAARATGLLVLEDHIRGCVVGASPDDQEAVLDELTTAIDRFNRTVG